MLNKKLEREKEKALTDAYSDRITVKDEEKMMKRAAGIARLEEKIKILSKEDVPSDYVDKRAISDTMEKLYNNIDNIIAEYNS